ncbi:MAG: DUF3078 domain-containing protein [Chitinophagales bacterium]|nr:DUF3078 domain-containing protein [Chitinophagales bacterium]
MKKVLTLSLLLAFCVYASAQEKIKSSKKVVTTAPATTATTTETKLWKTGGTGRLGFALNNYGNWAAGALNTTNLDGNVDLFADYQRGKFTWTNTGKFGLGLVGSNAFVIEGNDDTQFWRKSLDIFALGSAMGYKFNSQWAWTLPVTFTTQFAPTFQFDPTNPALPLAVSAFNPEEATSNTVSRFLSPAYLTAGTGIKWTPVPADNKQVEFSAELLAQSKNTIVGNEDIARTFSLTPGKSIVGTDSVGIYGNIIDKAGNEVQKIRPEFGTAANFFFAYKGLKNVVFSSRLGLFKNFIANKFNGIEDPKNTSLELDVNWLNKLDFNVPITLIGKTFNFTTTLEHQLIRDADIAIFDRNGAAAEGVQSRFFFGAGLTYQFGYKK